MVGSIASKTQDGRPEKTGCYPVIILHGIGAPQRPREPGEEVFWLSERKFLSALDQIAAMGPSAPLITFDDGNASDIEIALPALANRGLTATFFLLTARLGQPGSLREADVRHLVQAGHRIGLHGADHVDWRALDASGRKKEFIAARNKLAELANQPITEAAAPFGLYNRQVAHDLHRLGFSALYTSDRGMSHAGTFLQPRNCLEGAMDDRTLQQALSGHVPPLRKARRIVGIARKRLLPLRVQQ